MDFLSNIAHAALWVVGLMFIFSLIGLFATIKWIVGLFFGAERAVAGGVQRAEDAVRRK